MKPQSLQDVRQYYYRHERANAITHGLGLLASFLALYLLIGKSVEKADALHTWCYMIYGITMIGVFAASTVYHSVHKPRLKRRYQILDHASIYLYCAGIYTPFCLLALPPEWGQPILITNWSLAFFGIAFKLFFIGKYNLVSTLVYLGMGWLIIIAAGPLLNNLSGDGFWWLMAGGASYTLGVGFFLWEKCPYNHAIWHLFVLGGSLCHFICIWEFL